MFKKYLALTLMVFAVTVLVAGCGVKDEKTRLKEAMIDLACNVMKPMTEVMNSVDKNDEAALGKILEQTKDVESKMIKVVQNHGFKDKDDFEKSGEKYKDDKAFEDEIYGAVKSSCGFDMKESPGF